MKRRRALPHACPLLVKDTVEQVHRMESLQQRTNGGSGKLAGRRVPHPHISSRCLVAEQRWAPGWKESGFVSTDQDRVQHDVLEVVCLLRLCSFVLE